MRPAPDVRLGQHPAAARPRLRRDHASGPRLSRLCACLRTRRSARSTPRRDRSRRRPGEHRTTASGSCRRAAMTTAARSDRASAERLVALLRAELGSAAPPLTDSVAATDWQALEQTAEMHGLTPFLERLLAP